jgi:transcriptional regulator with XRE-family HTH domain
MLFSTVHSVLLVVQPTCIKLKMAKRKLQMELSLQQKSEVLQRIQKGESQSKLAEQYGVSNTIVSIKKNEHSIINAVESNSSQNRRRKIKKTENEEVNNIILEFFIKFRAQNIPVTGPMLQAKAAEIASSLQIEKFTASNGWLKAFRRRNNINFRVLCGESANVDKETADDWKIHLSAVVEGYATEDQFNTDEIAVFYRQLPRKSMVYKGESCKGGKLAKERLSIMLCCSATGEKLKPLTIGNAPRPIVLLLFRASELGGFVGTTYEYNGNEHEILNVQCKETWSKPPHCRRFAITLRHPTLGRILWSCDRPVAEMCTSKHTTLTRERHPYLGGIRIRIPSKRSAANHGADGISKESL